MRKHARAISRAKKILRSMGIRHRIDPRSRQCYARISEGFVHVGLNSSEFVDEAAVLSAVFHEIAHIVNYRNKKFYKYHDDEVTTFETVAYARRFGLRAEQHTDLVASKLMAKYFPKFKFRFTYNRPEMKRRYKDEFLPLLESYVS